MFFSRPKFRGSIKKDPSDSERLFVFILSHVLELYYRYFRKFFEFSILIRREAGSTTIGRPVGCECDTQRKKKRSHLVNGGTHACRHSQNYKSIHGPLPRYDENSIPLKRRRKALCSAKEETAAASTAAGLPAADTEDDSLGGLTLLSSWASQDNYNLLSTQELGVRLKVELALA